MDRVSFLIKILTFLNFNFFFNTVLSEEESTAIIKFRRDCRRQIKLTAIAFQINFSAYTYYYIFHVNRQYVPAVNFHVASAYTVAFQAHWFYVILSRKKLLNLELLFKL